MGQDRTIRFPTSPPTWEAIQGQLARIGEPAPLRMIDGLPAFPDETPEPGWRELRVGTTAGMVTIRRGTDSLTCVIWGTADPALTAAWHAVIWACAAAGGGLVDSPDGPLPSDEYARSVGLAPV